MKLPDLDIDHLLTSEITYEEIIGMKKHGLPLNLEIIEEAKPGEYRLKCNHTVEAATLLETINILKELGEPIVCQ